MSRRRVRIGTALCAAALLTVGAAGCNTRYGATITRTDDPVVLTGANTPNLIGADPQHVVGFAWNGSTWNQVPVQVDERDLVNPNAILHLTGTAKLSGTTTPYEILVYTPPATSTADYKVYPTYTPVDSDPTVDADDEITFMAGATGKVAPSDAGAPAGVDAASRQAVNATDPLDTTKTGTVYLFSSSTLTGGSGGTTGVDYTFSLNSGDYNATYKMGNSAIAPNNSWGYNPESSTVVAPTYQLGYSDRWINNSMKISPAISNGAELLDRNMFFATKVSCLRTEDTFSGKLSTPGAFIANISGPVRAIRSYMGANSFTFTNVTDVFYPSREDTTTHLIGHVGLPGFGTGTDLATGLTGMTYFDAGNSGLVIDGDADAFTPLTAVTGSGTVPPSWQMVKGAAGTVVSAQTLDTDIDGLKMTSTYADQTPKISCTGDATSWGYHGYEINSPSNSVPATDPTLVSNPATFVTTGYRFYRGPDFPVGDAPALEERAKNPIVTSVGD